MFINEAAYRARQRAVLQTHFDANETMFLERELTQLRVKMFEVQFPTPIARLLMPKATDIAPSATTYSYKVYEMIGAAKIINYKANDVPRIDGTIREVLGKVVPIGASFGWDINELREAARLNVPLAETKARAAQNFVERAIDTVLAFGTLPDEGGTYNDVGLNGLVNNSLVEGLGIVAMPWWLNPTPLDPAIVLASMSKLVAKIQDDSDNIWTADTLLLPVKHYTYVEQTPFSALTGVSILEVFKQNNPQIKTIMPWYKLNTGGAGGAPRAIAYQKTPDVLEAIIPQEFEIFPPEVRGFEFLQNTHARCGGTKTYQPMGIRYGDFATS